MASAKGRQARKTASVKRYRKLYAQAKKKGLVKGDKPVKGFVPSRYMKSRLNKLEPYLGKDYAAVSINKRAAKAFREAPSTRTPLVVGKRVLVKLEPGEKASNVAGILRVRQHLKSGTFERLPLPANVYTLRQFREWMATNSYLNEAKFEDEVFNFRIYDNDSFNSFGNIEAMLDELEKYNDIYDYSQSNQDDKRYFANFELFRSYRDWTASEHLRIRQERHNARRQERYEKKLRRMTPKQREEYLEEKRYLRRVNRKTQPAYLAELKKRRQARANETPAEREKRLVTSRKHQRASRARKKK